MCIAYCVYITCCESWNAVRLDMLCECGYVYHAVCVCVYVSVGVCVCVSHDVCLGMFACVCSMM